MAKAPKSRRRRPAPPQPGLIGRAVRGLFRLVWGYVWRLGMVVALIVAAATGYYYSTLPTSAELFDGRGSGSVRLYDANERIFAWRGEQYGGDLAIQDVSPHLVDAVIAVEDKRFYGHFGLDPRGIARAMYVNFQGPAAGARRLDDYPAAGQERLPDRAPHAGTQDQGSADGAGLGAEILQGRNPLGLHEPGLSGRRHLRVRSRRPALFRQVRAQSFGCRGRDAGRSAAGALRTCADQRLAAVAGPRRDSSSA